MEFFTHHRIVEENDQEIIFLFLNPGLTEFASELGTDSKGNKKNLNNHITSYIKKHLPNNKAKVVKVMLGTLLVSSMSLGIGQINKASAADYNMSYLFFGSTASQIHYVDRAGNAINTVSPSYFDLNADGTLNLSPQFSTTFIKEMKQRGVKVTPFLSNHWDRNKGRAALANRELLSQQLADVIMKYDLDGINIDIENVTEVDRANYTDLVRLINNKLPADKTVSVAVAANPYGWNTGWHGSYDYKALSQNSDYLMVMAYDESYPGGLSGPVASINWVEKTIKYSINQGVPPEKIVLGLPFYGRYWNDQEKSGGNGVPVYRVEELVQRYNGTITFDEKSKSAVARFTIREGDPRTTISGREFTNGTYTLWFENEDSIKAKLELVNKYGLKGTGSWALGQEDPDIWVNYRVWLQGEPFRDVLTHWAKNDIKEMNEKGWMRGTGENTFSPEKTLTRAEAAVILARALNLQPIEGQQVTYNDVSNDFWAKKEIQLVAQHGLIRGVADDEFAPNATITREQLAVILDRLLIDKQIVTAQGVDVISQSKFTDVSTDRWSKQSIVRMSQLGVVKGMNESEFKPLDQVTRAQMATLMNRISSYL